MSLLELPLGYSSSALTVSSYNILPSIFMLSSLFIYWRLLWIIRLDCGRLITCYIISDMRVDILLIGYLFDTSNSLSKLDL